MKVYIALHDRWDSTMLVGVAVSPSLAQLLAEQDCEKPLVWQNVADSVDTYAVVSEYEDYSIIEMELQS